MQLSEWKEKGADVSVFLALTLLEDPNSRVLHRDRECGGYLELLSTTLSAVRVTLDSELCDKCWNVRLPFEADAVEVSVQAALGAEHAYDLAEEYDPTGSGLVLFVETWYDLPDAPEVSVWSARLRERMFAGFAAARENLPDEAALFKSAGLGGADGRMGMLFVPAYLARNAVYDFGGSDLRLLAAHWDLDSPWPGLVVNGPLGMVEHLASQMVEALYNEEQEQVCVAELYPEDTPTVHDTALALFDLSDPIFKSLERAYAAARAV